METAQKTSEDRRTDKKVPGWVLNLLLMTISVLLPLMAAEVGLRLTHHKTISFDDRSFRASAWAFKPNTSSPSYVGVPIRINNLGMRGPEIPVQKTPGTFRILGLGDSITFGYGVEESATFLHVLQEQLNADAGGKLQYQVLNAGVPATGLDYYTHEVEKVGSTLKPDLILVCMALNDIDPELGPEPVEPHGKVGVARKLNQFLLTHSYLYSVVYVPAKSILFKLNILKLKDNEGFGFLAIDPPSPTQDHARAMMKLYLDRLARDAAQLNAPLAVVVFPVEPELSDEARKTYAAELHTEFAPQVLEGQPEKWVTAVGQQDRFPVLDLLPALRSVESEHPFLRNRSISVDPVHPSEVGHKACGLAIAQFLEQNKLTGM